MKSLKVVLLYFTLSVSTSIHAATWLTDLAAAKFQAAKEGKSVLINFTGSDWCGWCIRLRKEVFSQPEFEAYASKHLVLVEIDFPKRKPLPPTVQRANGQVADQFRIQGYPTLVFLNQQGSELGRTGYQPGGANAFVQKVARITGVPYDPRSIALAAPPLRPAPSEEPGELPLFGGAPAAPPPRYTDLVLKSISGTKERRFALLNNQTFASGETGRVKLKDGEVKVRCVEIRDSSVIVAVDGQVGQREIKLRSIQ